MRWVLLLVVLLSLPLVSAGISSPDWHAEFAPDELFTVTYTTAHQDATHVKYCLREHNTNEVCSEPVQGTTLSEQTSWPDVTRCWGLWVRGYYKLGGQWQLEQTVDVDISVSSAQSGSLSVSPSSQSVSIYEPAWVSLQGSDPNRVYKALVYDAGQNLLDWEYCDLFSHGNCEVECGADLSVSSDEAGEQTFTATILDSRGDEDTTETFTVNFYDPCDGFSGEPCLGHEWEYRCEGDDLEHCNYRQSGCFVWEYWETCDPGACNADQGVCEEPDPLPPPPDPCDGAQGEPCEGFENEFRCEGDDLEQCLEEQTDCYTWQLLEQCGGGTPLCNSTLGLCMPESIGGSDACSEHYCDGLTLFLCDDYDDDGFLEYPAAGEECADGDPCTADSCDAAAGECRNDPMAHGDACGNSWFCTEVAAGLDCLQACDEYVQQELGWVGKCLVPPVADASLISNVHCSLLDAACFACGGDYYWEGDDCVPVPECSGAAVQCHNADTLKECVNGFWTYTDCDFGCEQGACLPDPCQGLDACDVQYATRCEGPSSYERCDYYNTDCLHWGEETLCIDDGALCDAQLECTSSCGASSTPCACTENASTLCTDGQNIYWQDSCGIQGDLVESCDEACVLDAGEYRCEAGLSCTGENFTYECDGKHGLKIDESCGLVETIVTCAAEESCVAANESVSCEALCGEETYCDGECVDVESDARHCGQCSNQCAGSERCEAGRCVSRMVCSPVCYSSGDCAAGEVCVHPGDCARSECVSLLPEEVPVNVTVDLPPPVERRAGEGLSDATVTVSVWLEGPRFDFTVTNEGSLPVLDLSFTGRFAKSIAEHADHLTVRGVSVEVLDEDPKLRFLIPELESEKSFSVTVNHPIAPGLIDELLLSDLRYRLPREELLNVTEEVNFTLDSSFDGERTTIGVTLSPSEYLEGLSVPIEIPKCLAEYASQLDLEGEYQVIEEDPLIAWNFAALEEPGRIQFSVPKEVGEECLQQLKALAFARRVGKPLNPWLGLLLVPLLVAVIIAFQHFGGGKPPISKEEFRKIAEEQGVHEEHLERQWERYKREHL